MNDLSAKFDRLIKLVMLLAQNASLSPPWFEQQDGAENVFPRPTNFTSPSTHGAPLLVMLKNNHDMV